MPGSDHPAKPSTAKKPAAQSPSAKPSVAKALEELREAAVDRIIVLPLFPQYAAASTGSAS